MLSEFVSVIWQFLFVCRESFLCANLFDRIFRGFDLIFYLGISVPLNSSPIFLKFAGSG